MKPLLKKYDVPVPRYTSYPTVPYWSDSPSSAEWIDSLNRTFKSQDSSWSLYVHIPFCETLCTFCGCNTVITKGHEREHPYVQTVLSELAEYLKRVPALARIPLKHIHLGGGTPTFLSVDNLRALIEGIFKNVHRADTHFEGSLEVDPRRTSVEQIKMLRSLGFNRISMGVQDFDPEVQRLVNRIQPFEQTQSLTEAARGQGYESINYDLIYGLPKQSLTSFKESIARTISLRPDRIALYSLAVVPWIKPQQRLFKDEDLPVGEEKRALYEMAYEALAGAGYVEIGMDHFALPNEALTKALKSGSLHRNFMGYTDQRTDVLLGLGVSSISETPDTFHQNEKVLAVYEKKIKAGELATLRGHKLTDIDQQHREQILKFMTVGRVSLSSKEQAEDVRTFLKDMIGDGLVEVSDLELRLTELGRPYLRNACVALDRRLRDKEPTTRIFSKAL